ncbi:MAG: tetratricopeptide repeat protein, partial [Flavobacteriales bacterium]
MKKTKFIITILLLVSISFTYSQSQADSLKIIWENESLADTVRFQAIMDFYVNNTHSIPDSSLKLTKFHYQLAKQVGNRKEEALAINEKAIVFHMLGYDLDSVNSLLQEILPIYTELNNFNGIASTKNNIAALLQEQGDYQSAIHYYTEALVLFKEQKNNLLVADVLNNIAGIYQSIELYELALPNYKEAMNIYTQEGAEKNSGFLWLNMAVIYSKTGRTAIARKYFKKTYPLLKAKNDLYYLPEYFYHLAVFYQDIAKLDSALIMVEEGLKILTEIGNDDKISSSKLIKANLILDSDLDLAYRIAEDIKKQILNGNDKSQKSSLFQLLYKCYKKQEKYELALEMNEQYLQYADSVLIETNKTAVIREALKADYNAKLFDNRLESEKNEAQLKLKQLRLVYSLILIGAIIILILFFYYRFRIKKNQIQQEYLLDEIERLKSVETSSISFAGNNFQLNRTSIESHIDKKLNETDWKVLNILLDEPVITNKEIAEKAFMSVDGIGSSLRRMYEYFEIKESKYKKISLLLEAIKT